MVRFERRNDDTFHSQIIAKNYNTIRRNSSTLRENRISQLFPGEQLTNDFNNIDILRIYLRISTYISTSYQHRYRNWPKRISYFLDSNQNTEKNDNYWTSTFFKPVYTQYVKIHDDFSTLKERKGETKN